MKLFDPTIQNLTIFVLSYLKEHADWVPTAPHLVKVNLNELDIGEFQNNALAEYRFFMSDLASECKSEYIGCAGDRWDTKYAINTKLAQLDGLPFSPRLVWAAWRTPDWLDQATGVHPGKNIYLVELASHLNVKLRNEPFGSWANSFIMHRDVYSDFEKFFREAVRFCYDRWGFNYSFDAGHPAHQHCKLALLLECIMSMYLTNHTELVVEQIP